VLDFADAGEEGDAPLGDAYRVDARIVRWDAADVLRVPTNALIRDGASWAVDLVNERRARRTIVELGRHTGLEAEVTSGPSDGATLVEHPICYTTACASRLGPVAEPRAASRLRL
jgi:HlyD family secretion protein